jgi:hypothetical protein
MTKKQEITLAIGSMVFMAMLVFYNLTYASIEDAPLWGKLLFPFLQAVAFYFFMRWATKRYGHPKEKQEAQ